MASEEEVPMMMEEEKNEEAQLYKGEKAPESKHAEEEKLVNTGVDASEVVSGYPVGPDGVVVGEPVPMPRQPWSTSLLCCCGDSSWSDLQVCEFSYSLFSSSLYEYLEAFARL
jgi:hypothetical protein